VRYNLDVVRFTFDVRGAVAEQSRGRRLDVVMTYPRDADGASMARSHCMLIVVVVALVRSLGAADLATTRTPPRS